MFWGTDEILKQPSVYRDGNKASCFVYLFTDGSRSAKIGVATRPWERLRTLQIGSPNELTCPYLIPCIDENGAYKTEAFLHNNFAKFHIRGEWFQIMDKLKHEQFSVDFPASKYWPKKKTEKAQTMPTGLLIMEAKTIATLACKEYQGEMFLPAKDVAKLTGYAANTIRKACRRGEIPCIRVGDARNKRYLVNMALYTKQFRDYYTEEEKAFIREWYEEAR